MNTNHSNQSSNASDSIAQQMRERAERHKRRERERLSAHQNQPNHQNRQNRGSRRNQNQNQTQNQSYRPNQGSRGRLSAMRSQSNPEHDSSQNRLHAHNSPPSDIQSELSPARLPDAAPNRGSSTFISESPVSEQQQNVESDYEY